jgi:protein DEK
VQFQIELFSAIFSGSFVFTTCHCFDYLFDNWLKDFNGMSYRLLSIFLGDFFPLSFVSSAIVDTHPFQVPGKSAEECFNRVHADLSTPTPIAPRPRTSKIQFSPLGPFELSDPKIPNFLEPLAGRRRTAKQTSLAAQKTVRHLLKKQSLIDQAQEADHFSIFETSPSSLQLNIPLDDSPGTPDCYINSFPLLKYSVSSSARKRPLSRLNTKQAEPSPAVLKPIKNTVLHERYINQLSRREVAKKPRKKAAGAKATDPEKPLLEQQAGAVRAAKNALISEATDFIGQFKKLQANSLAHILENSEDDVDNSV